MAQTGPDYFVLLSGERRACTITRADAYNLYYQAGAGEVQQPWRTIKDWGLAERQGVRQAIAAVAAGQPAQAVALLKAITDAYIVLPGAKVPWVAESSVALVRAYTELKQYAEADAVAKKFMQFHQAEANRVKAYLAVALAGQGKFDEAIALLNEVVKGGEKKLAVTVVEGRTLGQAYLAMGDCYAGKGDNEKALECYLTTVVLYYHDESITRLAQAKADELKKKIRPQEGKPAAS